MIYLGKLGVVVNIAPVVVATASGLAPQTVRLADTPHDLTMVHSCFAYLRDAEASASAAANKLKLLSASGRVPSELAASYEALRQKLHAAQTSAHNALRGVLYGTLGQSAGDQRIAQIPYPGWLPRGDGMYATAAGQAPMFIGVTALRVIADVQFADEDVTKFTTAMAQAMVAQGMARALKEAATSLGSSTAIAPDVLASLAEGDGMTAKRKALISVGAVVGALALGGVAWWLIRRRKKSVRGIGRARARRSLRGATKLTTLTDSTPSRYQLEV